MTPWGLLDSSYQQPYARVSYAITPHVAYNLGWQLYNYQTHGNQLPPGLAPIGPQSFRVNTGTFSLTFTM